MPFPNQQLQPYTKAGIEWLNANQKGCYGLFQQKQNGWAWVYIGKADDIRKRLLEHLNGDNDCINDHMPTHYVGVVTADNVDEEKRLIREFDPYCNKQVG